MIEVLIALAMTKYTFTVIPDPPLVIAGIVTAYTSSEDETDSTPHITASNQKTRDGIVANNCLSFGTKVKINGKIYEVQDRKNSRYDCRWIDIWMNSKEEAIEWGIKRLPVTVL